MYFSSNLNGFGTALKTSTDYARGILRMPFDLARENYASSVRAGLTEQSMLASAKFASALSLMETMALGPLARSR